MKIPGITTILLYQSIAKEMMVKDTNVMLFDPLDAKNNKWIFEYFPVNICSKRWQDGNQLFYLLNENEDPCSFAWIRNGTEHFVGEINRKLIFQNKVNCIFDCITPENSRGKGYYPSLINQLSALENECPSIIYASSDNVPSNKGIIKAGFKLSFKLFRIFNKVKIANLNSPGIEFNVRKAR